MPLDLYCNIVAPFCRSVILLAEALEVELNFIEINVLKKEQFKPEFLAVSFIVVVVGCFKRDQQALIIEAGMCLL